VAKTGVGRQLDRSWAPHRRGVVETADGTGRQRRRLRFRCATAEGENRVKTDGAGGNSTRSLGAARRGLWNCDGTGADGDGVPGFRCHSRGGERVKTEWAGELDAKLGAARRGSWNLQGELEQTALGLRLSSPLSKGRTGSDRVGRGLDAPGAAPRWMVLQTELERMGNGFNKIVTLEGRTAVDQWAKQLDREAGHRLGAGSWELQTELEQTGGGVQAQIATPKGDRFSLRAWRS